MGFILRKTNESIFAIFKFLLSTEIKLVGLPQGTIKNWKFKLLIWFLKIMSNLLQLKKFVVQLLVFPSRCPHFLLITSKRSCFCLPIETIIAFKSTDETGEGKIMNLRVFFSSKLFLKFANFRSSSKFEISEGEKESCNLL